MLGCIALLERAHFPFHLTDIERNSKETCMKKINTSRLVLKAMSFSDCDNLRLILGDPETAWWCDSFVLDDCNRIFYNPAVEAVALRVLPNNLPSQAVARKAGFVLEPQKEWEKDTTFLDSLPMDRLVLTRKRHLSNKAA